MPSRSRTKAKPICVNFINKLGFVRGGRNATMLRPGKPMEGIVSSLKRESVWHFYLFAGKAVCLQWRWHLCTEAHCLAKGDENHPFDRPNPHHRPRRADIQVNRLKS